ncbi:hypothetical protein HDU93_009623, partial [Gonapodya sp. JEL0774]
GVAWMLRKVARALTPKDELAILDVNGVPTLKVTRLSLPSVLGVQAYTYPLDNSEQELEDKPYGQIRVKISKKDDLTLLQEVSAVNGVWTSSSVWTIEEEAGELRHYRRTTFLSDGKELKVVQKLITAIEANDGATVRKLLSVGVDPNNAWKQVTLTVKTTIDWFRTRDESDTIAAESALVIAIIRENVELVSALLDAGADPRKEVEWRISDYFSDGKAVTLERWTQRRWFFRYEFSSALALAVCAGPRVNFWHGQEYSDWERDAQRGKIRQNKPGAHVQLHNPGYGEAYVTTEFKPNADIVALLLRHGAEVTPQITAAASALPDGRIAEVLRMSGKRTSAASQQQQQLLSTAMLNRAPSLLSMTRPSSFIQQEGMLQKSHMDRDVDRSQLTPGDIAAAEVTIRRMQLEASNLQLRNSQLNARIVETTTMLLKTRTDSDQLRGQNAELAKEIAAQRLRASESERKVVELERALADERAGREQADRQAYELTKLVEDMKLEKRDFLSKIRMLEEYLARTEQHMNENSKGAEREPTSPSILSSQETLTLPTDLTSELDNVIEGASPLKKTLWVVHAHQPNHPDEIALTVGQQVFCIFAFIDDWGVVSTYLASLGTIVERVHFFFPGLDRGKQYLWILPTGMSLRYTYTTTD